MGNEVLAYLKSKDPNAYPYGSAQLFYLLDDMIMRALYRIIATTNLTDRVMASVIAWQQDNKRRKISSLSRNGTISSLLAFIQTDSIQLKREIIDEINLERSILFLTIKHFLSITEDYMDVVHKTIQESDVLEKLDHSRRRIEIEKMVGLQPDKDLYSTIAEVKMWYGLSKDLKRVIMEKYYRYIFSQVIKEANTSKIKISPSDMAHNYVLALSKAIDKYIVDKGTFTSYLDHWLKDAKTDPTSGHYVGLAYKMPRHASRSGMFDRGYNNIAVSLDSKEYENNMSAIVYDASDDVEETVTRQKKIERIRELAMYADPDGFAREALGLE